MIFSLDVRRARKGDCMAVHYGTTNEPGLMLIDAGPAKVYTPELKPRLDDFRKGRGLEPEDTLPVDLLMVSHIDDDHINGVLELSNELVQAKDSGARLPLKVRNFWHNTFDDIIGNKPDELLAAVTASFGAASLAGETDAEGLEPEAALVLASVGQGFRLRDDARKLEWRINRKFDGALVMATEAGEPLDMGKGLTFTVAGPMREELLKLQRDHDAFLKKKKEEKETQAALASFTDTSVANLSSIVVLAEVDGKKMLLTGDARGDKILKGLELVGLLEPDGVSKMHVDILKMPHHGSDRNIDPIFFQRISADHYVFSGNGEHGNPERDTLQMLLNDRGDEDYTVHLTYPIDETDVEREKNWIAEQEKERKKKEKKPQTEVREDWSPAKHSLSSFLETNEKFADKVTIVDKQAPHVIDLLDKVGF
jgi:hypothetical protein